MTYTLLNGTSGGVTRDIDRTSIPPDPNNMDWRDYQTWLSAGNTPNPAPIIIPPTPSITGRQFNGQAREVGVTAALNTVLTSTTSTAKPDDIRYVNSIGLETRVPVDNPKAVRVLTLAGVKDVPGFMAAALLLPS